jgi:hypothetical protein
MAGIKRFLDQLFPLACVLTNYKERGFDRGILEDLENSVGLGTVRPVVEGKPNVLSRAREIAGDESFGADRPRGIAGSAC